MRQLKWITFSCHGCSNCAVYWRVHSTYSSPTCVTINTPIVRTCVGHRCETKKTVRAGRPLRAIERKGARTCVVLSFEGIATHSTNPTTVAI